MLVYASYRSSKIIETGSNTGKKKVLPAPSLSLVRSLERCNPRDFIRIL